MFKNRMFDDKMLQKVFDMLATSLSVLDNYFNCPTKLFSDLYLVAKFLDTTAKSVFIHCENF